MRATFLARVLRVAAGSAVPGGGFLLAGWSPATALTLYWIENLVSAVAMGGRIALHRRSTRAAGHRRGQLGATYSSGGRASTPFRSFLAEFLVTSLAFTLAHGVFLAVVLGFLLEPPELNPLRQGVLAIGIFHGIALTIDSFHLDDWPFARLKHQAVQIMGRVVVVHLGILGGMVFFASRGTPGAFFAVFVWLKFLTDLGSVLPQYDPREPPRWLVRLMRMFPKQKGETFEQYWRRTKQEEEAQVERDDLPR